MRAVGIVYRKELLDSLRDRRTLISMIVVPILLMPLLTVGMGYLMARLVSRAQAEVHAVMLLGGEDSPRTAEALRAMEGLRVTAGSEDYAAQISDKKIQAAVELPDEFDFALARGEQKAVKIYYHQGELKSQFAAQRLKAFFDELSAETVRQRLLARNLPEDLIQPFTVERKNVAPEEKVAGAQLGGLIPYMIILLCMTGAMYPAMDLTAGEKERGTMETILCSPVSRTDLVLGKFLTVLTASLATAALAIASMSASFLYLRGAAEGLDPRRAAALDLKFDPMAIVAVFVMVLPVAVLFSAALLAISLFAKSFKEAQSYISPLMIVVILPAVAAILPGVELDARLAWVPILNVSLVSKEIMTGTYHWNYIAMIFLSSSLYAAAALFAAVKLFQREDVLFRA